MNDHEESFVRAFIVPDKQKRYLEKLASRRNRKDILMRLDHALDYSPKFATRIPPPEQTAALIFDRLRKQGAPDRCHAIAVSTDLDGQDLPLEAALREVVGVGNGVILSCIPGVLAYYESEELKGRFVFWKPPRP